jgi:hypothetical protein
MYSIEGNSLAYIRHRYYPCPYYGLSWERSAGPGWGLRALGASRHGAFATTFATATTTTSARPFPVPL